MKELIVRLETRWLSTRASLLWSRRVIKWARRDEPQWTFDATFGHLPWAGVTGVELLLGRRRLIVGVRRRVFPCSA